MKQALRAAVALATAVLLLADAAYYTVTGGHLVGQLTQRLPTDAAQTTGQSSVHFIDVGQADATLLLSDGQAILIDAGESASGQQVIDYLEKQGVRALDAVVATHPHADHIGGMASVLEQFPVARFYMSDKTATTRTFERMLDAVEQQGLTPIVPAVGDTLTLDSGAQLTFLGPSPEVSRKETNNASLIARFSAGGQTVLLMADAERESEQALLASGQRVRCDILKVGHHGAATSSTPALLEAASPRIAVISSGKNNDYGHPAPQTLETLHAVGVDEIYNTAEHGTVVLTLGEQQEGESAA